MQTALEKMEIMSMRGRSPGMFGECLNAIPDHKYCQSQKDKRVAFWLRKNVRPPGWLWPSMAGAPQ